MTKWIRWWGLGAFLVLVAVIGLLWIFFVDGWVKRLIEDVSVRSRNQSVRSKAKPMMATADASFKSLRVNGMVTLCRWQQDGRHSHARQ